LPASSAPARATAHEAALPAEVGFYARGVASERLAEMLNIRLQGGVLKYRLLLLASEERRRIWR
jgi:hypothetical protein